MHKLDDWSTDFENRGLKDNTLILYIWGDNGSSSEGQHGSISELLAQNNIPNTVEQQLAAFERLGGLEALGITKDRQHVSRRLGMGRQYAVQGHQAAGVLLRWYSQSDGGFVAKEDQAEHRCSFTVPSRDRYRSNAVRDPWHYATENRQRPSADADRWNQLCLHVQRWIRSARKRRCSSSITTAVERSTRTAGWLARSDRSFHGTRRLSVPRVAKWDSATDEWELYNLNEDFSQANNLAASMPEKLEELKQEFMKLAEANKDFPIGAGNWLRLHPEDRIKTPYSSWTFHPKHSPHARVHRTGLGRESNHVTIDVEVPDKANGVLYAVGGSSGGVTLYMDNGHLVYLYNMLILEQYEARSPQSIASGKHKIEVATNIAGPGQAGTVAVLVDGEEVGKAKLKRTVPAAFTASESFDVGADLGSTVSLDYMDRRPFEFDGTINAMQVDLK